MFALLLIALGGVAIAFVAFFVFLTGRLSEPEFLAWGWRVPFLLSVMAHAAYNEGSR